MLGLRIFIVSNSTDRYFASVAAVSKTGDITINRGADFGVAVGSKFLIVGIGEEVFDPDTRESLGQLANCKRTD